MKLLFLQQIPAIYYVFVSQLSDETIMSLHSAGPSSLSGSALWHTLCSPELALLSLPSLLLVAASLQTRPCMHGQLTVYTLWWSWLSLSPSGWQNWPSVRSFVHIKSSPTEKRKHIIYLLAECPHCYCGEIWQCLHFLSVSLIKSWSRADRLIGIVKYNRNHFYP